VFQVNFHVGPVHKRRPQLGEEGFVQCGHGGRGDSSDADVRTFCRKKLRIFRNLWCVRTDRGEGSIFRDFVRTSFTDGPFQNCPSTLFDLCIFRVHAAIYEAELDIYTSDRQILLVDGEYELSLTRLAQEKF